MFAPQFAVSEIVKKVASLDSARSLALIEELSLSGWELSSALRAHVRGSSGREDWTRLIDELHEFETRRGSIGGAGALQAATQNMIAAEWMRSDFDQGIHWFTREIERDFSNPADVENIANTLALLPVAERSRVIDWFERGQGQEGWMERVIVTYSSALTNPPLDGSIERLMTLIPSEEDRFQFVAALIGSADPSARVSLQHPAESLNRLLDAARLTEEREGLLRMVVEKGSWSSPSVR